MQEIVDTETYIAFLNKKFIETNFKQCPLCDSAITTTNYIAKHISIYCNTAENIEEKTGFPRALLSQIFVTIWKKKNGARKSKRLEKKQADQFDTVVAIKSYSIVKDGLKDRIFYTLELSDGNNLLVSNSQLLKTKKGSSISKQGYRMRMKNKLSQLHLNQSNLKQHLIEHEETIQQISTSEIKKRKKSFTQIVETEENEVIQTCSNYVVNKREKKYLVNRFQVPQNDKVIAIAKEKKANLLRKSVETTEKPPKKQLKKTQIHLEKKKKRSHYTSLNSITVQENKNLNTNSIISLINLMNISERRRKCILSCVNLFFSTVSATTPIGKREEFQLYFISNAFSFVQSMIKSTTYSVSHIRNTLQNILAILRHIVVQEQRENWNLKCKVTITQIQIELRRLNLTISKTRQQNSLESVQKIRG